MCHSNQQTYSPPPDRQTTHNSQSYCYINSFPSLLFSSTCVAVPTTYNPSNGVTEGLRASTTSWNTRQVRHSNASDRQTPRQPLHICSSKDPRQKRPRRNDEFVRLNLANDEAEGYENRIASTSWLVLPPPKISSRHAHAVAHSIASNAEVRRPPFRRRF